MPTLLIITDQSSKIIATWRETPGVNAAIAPIEGQTMHRLENVPVEVIAHASPDTYHAAITEHFEANKAKAKLLS